MVRKQVAGSRSSLRRPLKVVGIIPARWGSTRFPGKSLTEICGKPLIHWVIQNAAGARRLDRLLVATDDERIAMAARAAGGEAVMTHADHVSGTDRVAEALAVAGVTARVVLNIQGDEPLIEHGLIDALAEVMLRDSSWDMATAAAPIRDAEELRNPSLVKVVCDEQGRALYFSRSVIPYVREAKAVEGAGVAHWGHVGIYAYRSSFLRRFVRTPPVLLERLECLEQLRALCMGARILVLKTAHSGRGVDTPEDVQYVEALLRERRA